MLNKNYAEKILTNLFCNNVANYWVEGADINQIKKYPYNSTLNSYHYNDKFENVATTENAFFGSTGLPELYLGLLTRLPNSFQQDQFNYVELGATEGDIGYTRVPLHGKDIFNKGYILRSAKEYAIPEDNTTLNPDGSDELQLYCITNSEDIVFPAPKADTPWENIVGFGVFSQSSGDNLILWGKFDATVNIATDEILKIKKAEGDNSLGDFVVAFN